MHKILVNVTTGERKEIPLTQEEVAHAAALKAAEDAENAPEKRAARAVDSMPKIVLNAMHKQENRMRALAGEPPLTCDEFREFLIKSA